MKDFNIEQMLAHIPTMLAAEAAALHHGLKTCAVQIEKTAKSEFGHYQSEVGQFAAWAELAESTKADRLANGFTENDPLLRSGALRESITHEVHGLDAAVGSTADVMVYQELGTATMPPRPVLGPAALRNVELVVNTLGRAAAEGLSYGAGSTFTPLEN